MIIEYILQNPQIIAAIITAVCGILGIFINIIINISFRNRDYKNRNRIRQIENIENYYEPLSSKIEKVVACGSKLLEIENLNKVLDGQIGAEHANKIKRFKDSLEELYNYFYDTTYKVQDDYKLFKSHRVVKNLVSNLYKYNQENLNEKSLNELFTKLKILNYRINISETKNFIDSPIIRVLEHISIWIRSKKEI